MSRFMNSVAGSICAGKWKVGEIQHRSMLLKITVGCQMFNKRLYWGGGSKLRGLSVVLTANSCNANALIFEDLLCHQ